MPPQRERNATRNRRVRERRPVDTLRLRERFLIVCEGERTEPFYFESFRVAKDVEVVGAGANTTAVVREAIDRMGRDEYDQVWCVFDRDSFPAAHFNEALGLAKQHGIKVAYSNQAFEIWYLLHFAYHDSATSRDLYGELLTKRLGKPYRKNDATIYELLEPRQNAAIRNAKRLRNSYNPHSPERDNPCTTVYELVEALLVQVV
jgi:hypothetical protein